MCAQVQCRTIKQPVVSRAYSVLKYKEKLVKKKLMYLVKILDKIYGHFLTKFSLYFGKEYNSIKGAKRMDMRMENDNHIHNPKRMS